MYPDDDEDPCVFRIDLSDLGYSPLPVAFDLGLGKTVPRLLVGTEVLRKRPDARNPRLWVKGLAVAGAAELATRANIALRGRRAR